MFRSCGLGKMFFVSLRVLKWNGGKAPDEKNIHPRATKEHSRKKRKIQYVKTLRSSSLPAK